MKLKDNADWVYLAQDRDQWQAPVSTEINIRIA